MPKRQPNPVVMPISQAAAAFGLSVAAAREFIRKGGLAQGDNVEVGDLASFIARTTIGVRHAQAAA